MCSGFTGAAKRTTVQSVSEATEISTRWLRIKRAYSWGAAGMQDRDWFTLTGSPAGGCLMLQDLKHPVTPGYITDNTFVLFCFFLHLICKIFELKEGVLSFSPEPELFHQSQ